MDALAFLVDDVEKQKRGQVDFSLSVWAGTAMGVGKVPGSLPEGLPHQPDSKKPCISPQKTVRIAPTESSDCLISLILLSSCSKLNRKNQNYDANISTNHSHIARILEPTRLRFAATL
jgi:hypothetical protein